MKKSLKISLESLKDSFKKTEKRKTPKVFDLPSDYVISKFYELGYQVTYNNYNDTYNGCCPICREGKSWGKKKRCFYIPEKNLICCHNGECGWYSRPYKWIREVSKLTHEELWLEIEDGSFGYQEIEEEVSSEPKKLPSLPEDSINLFDKIQCDFYKTDQRMASALEFIRSRRLDTAVNRPDAFYISFKDFVHKNRVTIPFKDENGKIIFYQSRKIFKWDEKDKYISKLNGDKSICGIDKVDMSYDSVFLFEGPIDSFFIKNGLGVAGINKSSWNFTPKQKEQMESLQFFQKFWVLDSQWLDETALLKSIELVNMGETVFIWPETLGKRFKDLNEICIFKKIDKISPDFIKKNSFRGKEAILKLELMKV